jgi:dTDP-4-dehydrorhamnose 3,5-epimerase-like enzyme
MERIAKKDNTKGHMDVLEKRNMRISKQRRRLRGKHVHHRLKEQDLVSHAQYNAYRYIKSVEMLVQSNQCFYRVHVQLHFTYLQRRINAS